MAKHYGVIVTAPAIGYGGAFPVPTSFLISRDGIVRFTSAGDPGKIVEPEAIFPTLEALPARDPP